MDDNTGTFLGLIVTTVGLILIELVREWGKGRTKRAIKHRRRKNPVPKANVGSRRDGEPGAGV